MRLGDVVVNFVSNLSVLIDPICAYTPILSNSLEDSVRVLVRLRIMLPQDVLKLQALPAGYSIREVRIEDYECGLLDVLAGLTTVGAVSGSQYAELYQYWAKHKDTYTVCVIVDESDRIVACGTLFVEFKLIHGCAKAGHIEDIAVAKDHQGKKLGAAMIAALTELAQAAGCYKVILDCDEKNVKFYEKCGYRRAGVEMDRRFH